MWKITNIKIKPTLFLYFLGWRRETLFQQPSDFDEFNTRSCIQPSVYNYGTKIQSYNSDGLFKNKYCTDSRRIWTKNNKLQLVIWKFKLTLDFLITKINTKLLQNLWLSMVVIASRSIRKPWEARAFRLTKCRSFLHKLKPKTCYSRHFLFEVIWLTCFFSDETCRWLYSPLESGFNCYRD